MSVVETGSVERRGAIKTRAGDPSEPPLKKKTKKSQFWFRFRSRNRRRRRGEKKIKIKTASPSTIPIESAEPTFFENGAMFPQKRLRSRRKFDTFVLNKKNRKNVVAEERTRTDFVGDRRRRTVLFFWFTPQKRKTVVRMVPGFPKKNKTKKEFRRPSNEKETFTLRRVSGAITRNQLQAKQSNVL